MERRSESGTLSFSSQVPERHPHLMWPRSLPSGRTLNQVLPCLGFDLSLVFPCSWHRICLPFSQCLSAAEGCKWPCALGWDQLIYFSSDQHLGICPPTSPVSTFTPLFLCA